MGYRQVILQRAYLLHSRPYRDNSRLLNLFTQQDGHISAIAYTSSKGKNSKAGYLQPFAELQLDLKGTGGLKILSSVEHAQKSFMFAGQQLFSAFYVNELLVRLLPENIAATSLYTDYSNTLKQLASGESAEPILRRFEMALLEELGLGIDFSMLEELAFIATQNHEQALAQGDVREPQALYLSKGEYYYHYRPEFGFVLADTPHEARYAHSHLMQISQQQLSDASVLLTYKRLMRQLLTLQLGGKPLHSRSLFASYLNKGQK